MAKVKSCGFLIYRLRPKLSFLLMEHDDRWDLPKGHVDPGESNLVCALRELEEETGIQESDIRLDETFKFRHSYVVKGKRYGEGRPIKKKLIIFLAELVRDVEIQITEHKGFQWMDWNPPHDIQIKTINPLLAELHEHWSESRPDSGIQSKGV